MEFRFPRPLHGSRAFLGEVGVIVLGVLIALAAGQAADAFRTRIDVGRAREALRGEIQSNLSTARERVATAVCVEHRLDALSDILQHASQTRRLPPLGAIANPGTPLWDSGAWDTFNSGGTMSQIPQDERLALSGVYEYLGVLRGVTQRDGEAWRVLAMMVGPGRPLDSTSEGALYRALSEARSTNRTLASATDFLANMMSTSQFPAFYARRVNPADDVFPQRRICDPIDFNPPPRYGEDAYAGGTPGFRINRPTADQGTKATRR